MKELLMMGLFLFGFNLNTQTKNYTGEYMKKIYQDIRVNPNHKDVYEIFLDKKL